MLTQPAPNREVLTGREIGRDTARWLLCVPLPGSGRDSGATGGGGGGAATGALVPHSSQ
ncbi:hypothetical protein [Kibdelosporangium phytohabitans]|uniref:hypothetical protein n=1 Tax=Kibdelosporangium phytohabitans TaxID=860235 RepID=UPI001A072F5A|nr:hypothetical protein [Kibdelosporangium phytohabitans]MBE1461006.1 hypothetical protein [Kibdelosporangium phytohabitans]